MKSGAERGTESVTAVSVTAVSGVASGAGATAAGGRAPSESAAGPPSAVWPAVRSDTANAAMAYVITRLGTERLRAGRQRLGAPGSFLASEALSNCTTA